MILFIYSIYDEKVESYSTPFFAATNPAAIRMFTDLATDGQSSVSKHPQDYTLYQVGKWDDSTGQIETFENINNLGRANEYQPKPILKEVVNS